jgi:hypothetical protein
MEATAWTCDFTKSSEAAAKTLFDVAYFLESKHESAAIFASGDS